MTLFVQYFIPRKQLYVLRGKHSPITRSRNKLQLQHLVVTNSMRPAVVVDESELFVTTRCCNYSLFVLLMMGECLPRNV
jgi:hypothetical protein